MRRLAGCAEHDRREIFLYVTDRDRPVGLHGERGPRVAQRVHLVDQRAVVPGDVQVVAVVALARGPVVGADEHHDQVGRHPPSSQLREVIPHHHHLMAQAPQKHGGRVGPDVIERVVQGDHDGL